MVEQVHQAARTAAKQRGLGNALFQRVHFATWSPQEQGQNGGLERVVALLEQLLSGAG